MAATPEAFRADAIRRFHLADGAFALVGINDLDPEVVITSEGQSISLTAEEMAILERDFQKLDSSEEKVVFHDVVTPYKHDILTTEMRKTSSGYEIVRELQTCSQPTDPGDLILGRVFLTAVAGQRLFYQSSMIYGAVVRVKALRPLLVRALRIIRREIDTFLHPEFEERLRMFRTYIPVRYLIRCYLQEYGNVNDVSLISLFRVLLAQQSRTFAGAIVERAREVLDQEDRRV